MLRGRSSPLTFYLLVPFFIVFFFHVLRCSSVFGGRQGSVCCLVAAHNGRRFLKCVHTYLRKKSTCSSSRPIFSHALSTRVAPSALQLLAKTPTQHKSRNLFKTTRQTLCLRRSRKPKLLVSSKQCLCGKSSVDVEYRTGKCNEPGSETFFGYDDNLFQIHFSPPPLDPASFFLRLSFSRIFFIGFLRFFAAVVASAARI